MADVTPFIQNITSEHADKDNFISMVTASVQPFADIKALYEITPSLFMVDTAVGQQLDVVGQWVGVSRYLNLELTGVYFALDDASVGFDAGVWKGPTDPDSGLVALPDEYYRLVIKARILNNSWDGSKDGIYALADEVYTPLGFSFYVEDYADLSIAVGLVGTTPPPPILTALVTSGALDVKGVTIRIRSRAAQQGPVFAFDINSPIFQGFDSGIWSQSF